MSCSAPETRPPLRVGELAELLQVSHDSILRAIARGDIEATKLGRLWLIPATEADRLIRGKS